MCRISPISDDWVVKGFHLHVLGVELAMRPDHRGGIVFRKVFSSTKDKDAAVAISVAEKLLRDARWRARFRVKLRSAIQFMNGDPRLRPLGRAAEFRFLTAALDRLEAIP